MIPAELEKIFRDHQLETDEQFDSRLEFAIACIERAEHLLTDADMQAALAVGKNYVAGRCSRQELQHAADTSSKVARSHAGSNSFDGSGNAAVSTSNGVAAALAGRARQAAEYAAYAIVYSYSSSAVSHPEAYRDEQAWQVEKLKQIVAKK